MTRDEIVTALRQCPRYGVDCSKGVCAFFKPNGAFEDCIKKKNDAAADLIENQQRHIEALMKANAGLRDTVLRRDAQIADMSGRRYFEIGVCGGEMMEILKIVFPLLMVAGALGSFVVNIASKGDWATSLQWLGACILFTALNLKSLFTATRNGNLAEVSAGGIYRTVRIASGSWGWWSKKRRLKNARCAANR